MKICLIQPAYSTDYEKSDLYFEEQLKLMRQCDDSVDIIIMPESCDIPCLAKTREEAYASYEKYNKIFLDEVSATAKRCSAIVFANARSLEESGLRNTTYAFDREGKIVGKYFKEHLTPGEVTKTRLDSDYSFEHSEPTVIEIEGYRFGFLVCYDFYFYEAFSNLARQNLDFVIGCSHQRSDTHLALEIFSQTVAYNTNTYVLRASVSMDESSDIGGGSMVVAPNGEVLLNMKSRVGLATVEIDPDKKYFKPAGFGNPPAAHYEYIEKGRRPWKYRPAGSAIVRHDEIMPYPRACTSGYGKELPERSLAAFGAAISEGAEEIIIDAFLDRNGEPVSVSGVSFEQVLKKFSCHAVMNIDPQEIEVLAPLVALIKKYDCEKYVYFTSDDEEILKKLATDYPSFARCYNGDDLSKAEKFGCKKIEFNAKYITKEKIQKAHEKGFICNLFVGDSNDAEKYLDIGIDVILTNDYNNISNVISKREKYITYLS